MKKLLAAIAAAACAATASAHAVPVDFANEADTNGEKGLASGSTININGVNMRLHGYYNGDDAFPYLDAGDAGLGVCKVLDADDQCTPGSDDNVTDGESALIAFFNHDFSDTLERSIEGLVFRDAQHDLIDAANDGIVRIRTDNGSMTALFSTFIAMAAGGDAFFADTTRIFFEYVNKQFYVSALEVSDVPIPAAMPLLLSGLAGLGFASRRRKRA